MRAARLQKESWFPTRRNDKLCLFLVFFKSVWKPEHFRVLFGFKTPPSFACACAFLRGLFWSTVCSHGHMARVWAWILICISPTSVATTNYMCCRTHVGIIATLVLEYMQQRPRISSVPTSLHSIRSSSELGGQRLLVWCSHPPQSLPSPPAQIFSRLVCDTRKIL